MENLKLFLKLCYNDHYMKIENIKTGQFNIPIAIVVAGLLISTSIFTTGAVFLGGKSDQAVASVGQNNKAQQPTTQGTGNNVTPPAVTSADHILGNANAKIVLLEYTDLECPYCDRFQQSLHQAFDAYGKDNSFAWAVRNFAIHPGAPYEAQGAECVAQIGGQKAYFDFIDKTFATTVTKKNLDKTDLSQIASSVGVDTGKFESCLDSGKNKSIIDNQGQEARAAGARGTPFSLLIYKVNGQTKTTPIDGSISYDSLKALIDKTLTQL